MSNILKSIHKLEDKFDNRAERFAFRHPHAAVLAMFIGLPVFILAAVSLLTVLVTLPVTLFLGELLSPLYNPNIIKFLFIHT